MDRKADLIVTGGTLLQRANSHGRFAPSLEIEDLMRTFPDAFEGFSVNAMKLMNKDSVDLQPSTLNKVIDAVYRSQKSSSSFMTNVTGGTDTMDHYAPLASFAVYPLAKPLNFVGAMKAPDQPDTDVPFNIKTSLRSGAIMRQSGVIRPCVTMCGRMISPTRLVKIDADNGFCSSNEKYMGRFVDGDIEIFASRKDASDEPIRKYRLDEKATVKTEIITPDYNTSVGELKRYDAVLFVAHGPGNVPSLLRRTFDGLIKADIPIAVCARSPISHTPSQYEAGAIIRKAGGVYSPLPLGATWANMHIAMSRIRASYSTSNTVDIFPALFKEQIDRIEDDPIWN